MRREGETRQEICEAFLLDSLETYVLACICGRGSRLVKVIYNWVVKQ